MKVENRKKKVKFQNILNAMISFKTIFKSV